MHECLDEGQKAGGKLGHELLSAAPTASSLCGQETQPITGIWYLPLILSCTHPQSVCPFCTPFLTSSVTLSVETSKRAVESPVRKAHSDRAGAGWGVVCGASGSRMLQHQDPSYRPGPSKGTPTRSEFYLSCFLLDERKQLPH